MRKKYVDKGRGALGKPSVLDAAPEPIPTSENVAA